jgi:hypothetical protein
LTLISNKNPFAPFPAAGSTCSASSHSAFAPEKSLRSIGPARMLADVSVARPRAAHTPAERAALRDESAQRRSQPFSQATSEGRGEPSAPVIAVPRQRKRPDAWLQVCPGGHIAKSSIGLSKTIVRVGTESSAICVVHQGHAWDAWYGSISATVPKKVDRWTMRRRNCLALVIIGHSI